MIGLIYSYMLLLSIIANVLLYFSTKKLKIRESKRVWYVGHLNERIKQLETELNFALKLKRFRDE